MLLCSIFLLHGGSGFWDEIFCLALPATLVMVVALAVLWKDRPVAGRAGVPGAADEATGDEARAGAAREEAGEA
ncbi:MAG TPA: hypothetical protein VFW96_23485 [Thermomicrobiales bacterium]|nr:hypothetical protein [Thermomicrobiales bacterium]